MMQIRQINPKISVSPQIAVSEIAAIKAAGFVAVINNRPDGEEPGQPSGAAIEAAARAAGLDYRAIPLGRDGVTPELVSRTLAFLDETRGPVLAYCRTGARSMTLWTLSQAGRLPAVEIIGEARHAGYDMSHLARYLGAVPIEVGRDRFLREVKQPPGTFRPSAASVAIPVENPELVGKVPSSAKGGDGRVRSVA